MAKKETPGKTMIADNRKARFEYEIKETFEAGLVLSGTEVKSLRAGKANIKESYVSAEGNELWLINADIPIYAPATRYNHEPKQHRKLLMSRREINRLSGAIQREGLTVTPLKLYFNKRGIAKLEVALAKGKKLHDKRQTQRDRDWGREKARLMREKG